VLWLLFELPAALTSTELDLSALRLTLDLPLLLTLWLGTLGREPRALTRIALGTLATVLVLYRVDQWVCWTLLRAEPLLYDQLFMLKHLLALIDDLMSIRTVLVLLSLATLALGVHWLTRRLLARARLLAVARQRRNFGLLALVWCALLMVRFAQLKSDDPAVHWLAPEITRNVRKSVRTYRAVQKRLNKSPYTGYEELALRDKPDVLLFIVESYGRLLSVEEKTREPHAALLAELEHTLSAAGYHAASAFAQATVSGGRSWIAEGTMLMGTPIRYEAMFQHIVAQRPPSFVSFLARNGYETALLAPADRERAGFHPENRYAFQHLFSYDQLHYKGPPIGWGLVPDQYSIAFIDRELLSKAQKPVFLDFHMVSSHAPWSEVPSFEADPARLLAATSGESARAPEASEEMIVPFRRYARGSGRYAYMRHFDDAMREGYQATISYDLRAIAQYLLGRDKDALVIILGDHQPPVIAREDKSFDAPIHVLSRDPARLTPLRELGFVSGLAIDKDAPAALDQAGFFSLWVHTLMAMNCQGCILPKVHVHGDHVLAGQ
jgi:Sulfatase